MESSLSFNLKDLRTIESHLETNTFLSRNGLPGQHDSEIFFGLQGSTPDKGKHPNLYRWFLTVSKFNEKVVRLWAGKEQQQQKRMRGGKNCKPQKQLRGKGCKTPQPDDFKEKIEQLILQHLNTESTIKNSIEFAEKAGLDHQQIVGQLLSLQQIDYIKMKTITNIEFKLLNEGIKFLENGGTPEFQLFGKVPSEGIERQELQSSFPALCKHGLKNAMKKRWFKIDKGRVLKAIETAVDEDFEQLVRIKSGDFKILKKNVQTLKKRKCIQQIQVKYFEVKKGAEFRTKRVKLDTDLTSEMIKEGSWKEAVFKEYNYNALGKEIPTGNLHPLLKVREQFRQVLMQMGFQEMPTNKYVESSFWNFDTLFQPQAHPARDAHDTFFLKHPKTAEIRNREYLKETKAIHEVGGYGSTGYHYDWKEDIAKQNIMRTHTTAISSQMLYRLAQQKNFKPTKYFSIDRVFRNETLDATHLAEFHQVEGMVIDRNLSLCHLKGIIGEFFKRVGMTKVKFKPAYNPYTEPSMEIFAYHPGLKQWVEIGNSGIFRPEMLRPMGFPEDISVIAWGLSLERPTMINGKYDNIRVLFGDKLKASECEKNPIQCFDL